MATLLSPQSAEASAVEARLAALEERLRRRERELHAIHRVSNALHAGTSLAEMERQALLVAIELLDAAGGTIYVHDPQQKVLVFKHVISSSPEIVAKLQGMRMPDSQGVAGAVFQAGVRRITTDVSAEREHNSRLDEQTQFVTTNMLTVPLKSTTGTTLGVLQVLNKPEGGFDDDDWEVLEIISAQAASAMEAARLHEEARRASVINLIGDISHDVKNLLTPVVTGTQTLEMMMDAMFQDLEGVAAGLEGEKLEAFNWAIDGVKSFYKEAMEMIYDGAQDAQERVREIADAIKGIIAEPHFEEADFRERADSVARVLKLVAERKGVTIDLSGVQNTGTVELDKKAIYNAIYNLINNAIPETPEGGMIMVRTRRFEADGEEKLEIQIADTGQGMPAHIRERMFTENAISTKPGGTGLGTRIVKNVVDLHHGTIRVDSAEGKGTTFTIQIPVRQPRGPEAPTS